MLEARLTDLTEFAAKRFGSRDAFTAPGEGTYNFVQINELVARCAGGLAKSGIQAGDRVVLHLPNCLQWIVFYHAIARMGGVVIPANFLLSVEEIHFIVADSQAKALIVPAERLTHFESLDLQKIVVGDHPIALNYLELCTADPVAPAERHSDDLFTIGYTSGTTGKPKGAMLTHGNIFGSLAATATVHVRRESDVVISSLPFPHVYGNIVMNAVFLAGTKLVTTQRFEPGEALRLIAEHGATLFEGVPTMYYQMLAHPGILAADLSSLTRCTVGGQTMPTAKIDEVTRRFNCPLLELWGMTEVAGPAITHSPYWAARHGSIGMLVPGMEARIESLEDSSKDAPFGQAGELLVRGAQVTIGYWNNTQATADAFVNDGWLSTGDIAWRDKDGYYYVVDRKKDMIITAGYNIYPAELEQVIASHPAVAMTAVAGVHDEEKGELAYAFIVLHRDMTCDEQDILMHCRKYLAAYKVPRRILFVESLPKTSTGKILRRTLRDDVERISQQAV